MIDKENFAERKNLTERSEVGLNFEFFIEIIYETYLNDSFTLKLMPL